MSYNLKHLATLYIIIGLLIFSIFLQRSCNNKQPFDDTIFKPSEIKTKVVTKYKNIKGEDVLIPGKIDTVEIKVFENANDSTQFNMFTNATKIRSYKNDFSDNDADISIYTETKGELLKIVPTVHIKQVKKVETKFALYVGGGISNNLQFNNFAVQAKIGLQNKKGDILSIGYDTQQNINVGYSFRIINIKK
jgi:hypothetical protein